MAFFATDDLRNDLATFLGTQVDALSLHSANPGTTGVNEIDVDARQEPSWTLGSTGELELSGAEDFTGADPETTVTHVGLWLDGVFRGHLTRTSGDAATNAAGEYSVSGISVTNEAS